MTLWEIMAENPVTLPFAFTKVFIRMYGVARNQLPQLEKELGGKARYLYLVDHRENRREIF